MSVHFAHTSIEMVAEGSVIHHANHRLLHRRSSNQLFSLDTLRWRHRNECEGRPTQECPCIAT